MGIGHSMVYRTVIGQGHLVGGLVSNTFNPSLESLQGVGALPLRRFVDLAAGWGGNAAIAAVVRHATVAGSRWDHVGPAISIGLP